MGAVASSSDAAGLVGQRINDTYEILRDIATGGMSRVYLARHVVMDREVALKVLRTDLPPDSDGAALFLQEVRACSRLTHPNNITVYEFGRTAGDDIFLVMEFIRGEPLAAVLARKGRLPFQRVTRMMVQICGALAEAHAAGIVHRDLKPENIMLEEERHGVRDYITLLDYGIAHLDEATAVDQDASEDTMDELFTGTPEFTSPEQALGKAVDARSDVYALGVLLYLLVSGRVPFSAASPLDTLIQHLKVAPPPLPAKVAARMPEGLEALLQDMLAKDPEERPADCVEVRKRFIEVLNASYRRPMTATQPIQVALVMPESRQDPGSRPVEVVEPSAAAAEAEEAAEAAEAAAEETWEAPVGVKPEVTGGPPLVPCRSARSCYRSGTRNLPMAVRWLGPDHVGFVVPGNDDIPQLGHMVGLLVPAQVVGVEIMWVEGRVTSRVASDGAAGHAVLVELNAEDRPAQWGALSDYWMARTSV